MENLKQAPWSKNQRVKQPEQRRSLGDCWQWKANGQCSKGDDCSFRHDMNKRAKSTHPNPSPRSSTQQRVKNASRTRSPRGRSPSGPLSRGTLKSKGGGKLSVHLCADGKRLKLFFAQLFLSISSASTEQSRMCVRNTVLVKQVRRDPHWQSNLTYCSRQQTYW